MLSLHDILINEVKDLPRTNVALMLSSGIDSQSLLFAMLECRIVPHIYSFTLEDRESTDFMYAKSVANKYNCEFTKISLPISIDMLVNDCYIMAHEYGAKKKTEFECFWPFLHSYPIIKEKYVVTGIPADGHFCLSKKGILHFRNKVDEFRESYFSNPNAGQRLLIKKLAEKYGKVNIDPYYSQEIINYLKGASWEELNMPQQKMPIRNAFP